jgi:hypothetical protein
MLGWAWCDYSPKTARAIVFGPPLGGPPLRDRSVKPKGPSLAAAATGKELMSYPHVRPWALPLLTHHLQPAFAPAALTAGRGVTATQATR